MALSPEFKQKRAKLFKKLEQSSLLTEELKREIIEVYGQRGIKALEAIKEGRVIKRGERWFVQGKAEEYEVVKNLCTCKDFVLNVVTGRAGVDACYHVLAKRICELLDAYYVSPKNRDAEV